MKYAKSKRTHYEYVSTYFKSKYTSHPLFIPKHWWQQFETLRSNKKKKEVFFVCVCVCVCYFFNLEHSLVSVEGIWRPEQWPSCRHVAWCIVSPTTRSVNRDNKVVAGLHPVTPLHVCIRTLSLSLSLYHNVWTSLSVQDWVGGRVIPSSSRVIKSHTPRSEGEAWSV